MLAYNENRDDMSFRRTSGDKVVFKNVQKRYKFPNSITVEYILSPKVKTSTHDYVGIYPRHWKHLREFVGFEHPIPAPFEEPNLYRCLQFTCQFPHVRATHNQDYQFVYVSQSQEILGKSVFFQFVEEDVMTSSTPDWHESDTSDWWMKNESGRQEEKITTQTLENANIQLTPYEIAYNQCFFRSEVNDSATDKREIFQNTAASGEASKDFTPRQEASSACYIPERVVKHEAYPIEHQKPRRRALVKTRFDGQSSYGNDSPELVHRNSTPYMVDQGVNTGPDLTYSHNWLQAKRNSDMINQSSAFDRSTVNCGTIPKRCPKCHDHIYKKQLMQHELSQAYEQVRDLKTELDKVKNDLQLSQAAQAKLKVLADIANTNCSDVVTFLNNLMMSLVNQYKTRIVNYDGSVMYVTRELVSPGWLLQRGQPKTLICARPNVRVINGRDKLLKAIIGQQEQKIRELHSRLCDARRIIEQANLQNYPTNLELPATTGNISPPQMTPRKESNCSIVSNNSTFDLADIKKVIETLDPGAQETSTNMKPQDKTSKNLECVAMVHRSGDYEEGSLPPPHSDDMKESWQDAMVVETKFFQMDSMQSWDHEVILDDDHIVVSSANKTADSLEANNNNYHTKNMNSDSDGGKPNCAMSEPTSTDVATQNSN